MNEREAKKLVKSLSEEDLKDLIEFMEVLFQMREVNQCSCSEQMEKERETCTNKK